jgi:hypothetical protein
MNAYKPFVRIPAMALANVRLSCGLTLTGGERLLTLIHFYLIDSPLHRHFVC